MALSKKINYPQLYLNANLPVEKMTTQFTFSFFFKNFM